MAESLLAALRALKPGQQWERAMHDLAEHELARAMEGYVSLIDATCAARQA